jgi:hypothetical protein
LRKCDFLTEKLGIGRIRIRNDLFRIRIRILQKFPDPQHCKKDIYGDHLRKG